MKTQNKKAKLLNKRSNQIDQIFTDVEDKYTYCNLKAYSRRMLQPMLNEKQEFVRLKWLQNNKQFQPAINSSFPWQNTTKEEMQTQVSYVPLSNLNINQSQEYYTPLRNKLQNAIKKRHHFSLNDVIEKEEIAKKEMVDDNNICQHHRDEQQSDIDENTRDFQEYKGCSLSHSSKYISQNVTFYQREFKQNLKSLPKIQEKNDLIRRISSLNVIFKELEQARSDKNYQLQKYIVEDFNEYKAKSQEEQLKASTQPIPKNKILSDYKTQLDTKQEEKNNLATQRNASIDQYNKQIYIQDSYFPQKIQNQKVKKSSQTDRIHQNSPSQQKLSQFFIQKGENKNRSLSNRINSYHSEQNTTISKRQQNTTESEYQLDSSIINNTKYNETLENETEQSKIYEKSSSKKSINFQKMYDNLKKNRIINPIKYLQKKKSARNYSQDTPLQSRKQSYDNSQNFKCQSFHQNKHLSQNNSEVNFYGGLNSQTNSFRNDQVIQQGEIASSQNLKRNKMFESKAFGTSISSPTVLSKQKKIYNNSQKEEVPEFIKNMKNLIFEIEKQGDLPLSFEQNITLANSLGLLSIHNDLNNRAGQNIVDYEFDNTKEHFIVPQKTRDNTFDGAQLPPYGSIGLLDKIYEISLPQIYLKQGFEKTYNC